MTFPRWYQRFLRWIEGPPALAAEIAEDLTPVPFAHCGCLDCTYERTYDRDLAESAKRTEHEAQYDAALLQQLADDITEAASLMPPLRTRLLDSEEDVRRQRGDAEYERQSRERVIHLNYQINKDLTGDTRPCPCYVCFADRNGRAPTPEEKLPLTPDEQMIQKAELQRIVTERMNDLRDRCGSNTAFAAKLGVPRSVVQRWVQGKSMPTLDHYVHVARVFGESLEWLVGNAR